jgi:copper chaperone CopZ
MKMKNANIAAFFCLAIAVMILSGCQNKANSKEINIKLDSLSVNGKSLIEQDISREKGVYFVKAHLRKKIVTIVYDTTLQTPDQLFALLEKKGYKTEVTLPPVPDKDK